MAGGHLRAKLPLLLSKPNAYADFSEQTFMNYPRTVSQDIREWLEHAPEKVMFATDAYPFSEEMGWEEAGWVAASTGRQALGAGAHRDDERRGDHARARRWNRADGVAGEC